MVHRCFNPLRFPGPAQGCRCNRWVKKSLADRMVTDRSATQMASGDVALIVKRVRSEVPRAETIQKRHIEQAYCCGDEAARRQRQRINLYGAMNRAELESRVTVATSRHL